MMGKGKSYRKYFFLFSSLMIISAAFLFFTLFFETHFYPGTVINGVNVSCDTPAEADKKLANWASAYMLTLTERGGVKEQVYGREIGLKCDLKHRSELLKNKQNRTFWVISFFDRNALKIGNAFTYDVSMLEKRYSELSCVDISKVVMPKNATLVYTNGVYEVVKEVYGNKVNDAILYYGIKEALADGKTDLNLETIKCYVDPTIKFDSKKLANTKAVVEKYIAAQIIYPYYGGDEIVDANEIGSWIEFEEDLDIVFNTEEIKSFLKELATHYNTYGKERDFVTSLGQKIKISGGDYGWKVDIKKETAALTEAITNGRMMIREPIYSQKAMRPIPDDIGSTYIEIDLSNQHLWFYKAGKLMASGAVVSGDMNEGHKTPEGIYSLKYKIKNAVLKGPNYRANVSYWMPFNDDIGIHDASWRSNFGRDIYLARGSHGCINVAYYLAEKLYKNISVGTPVICYY